MLQLLRNDLVVSLNAEKEDHDLQPLIRNLTVLSSLWAVFFFFLQTRGDAFSTQQMHSAVLIFHFFSTFLKKIYFPTSIMTVVQKPRQIIIIIMIQPSSYYKLGV